VLDCASRKGIGASGVELEFEEAESSSEPSSRPERREQKTREISFCSNFFIISNVGVCTYIYIFHVHRRKYSDTKEYYVNPATLDSFKELAVYK
jgi:hypothetical protein